MEYGENVPDKLATPVETMMAEERRHEIIRALPTKRWQMAFLLMEYGFNEAEIAAGMRMQEKSVRNIKYFIRSQIRKDY